MCRNLALSKKHVVPIVAPYAEAVQAHVDPYVGPYLRAASPFTKAAWKTASPYYKQANKHGNRLYKRHVEPVRKKAVKRTKAYLDPHIKTARGHYKQKVQPHVDTAQRTIKPYQKIYTRDVAPYLSQAYAYSLTASSTTYTFYVQQVHPRVVATLQQLHAFYVNHADPAVRRGYSVYVRPQVEKLLSKLYERKAHAVGADVLRQTQENVDEAAQKGSESASSAFSSSSAAASASSSSSSAPHAGQTQEGAYSTGVTDSVKKAASTAMKAKPKPTHFVPDTLMGGGDPEGEDSPEEIARLDALLQAELSSTKEQLEAWEVGQLQLLVEEYKLFTERIADLRNARMADLPDHFDGLMKTAQEQVTNIIERVASKYESLAPAGEMGAEERFEQLAKMIEMPLKKLRQSRTVAEEAITSYDVNMAQDEAHARDASLRELQRFTREAINAFYKLLDDAEFERTVEDFDGWDKGMVARTRLFGQELDDLRRGNGTMREGIGATDLRREAKLAPHFASLRTQIDTLYGDAAQRIESYGRASPLETVGAAAEAVRKQAQSLSEQAAQSMSSAAAAARERLAPASGQAASSSSSSSRASTDASDVQEKVKEAAAAAGEAIAGEGGREDSAAESPSGAASSSPGPSDPEPVAGADAEEPTMSIQPVEVPGDGVDAEGNVVPGGEASKQFGAKGSGEGRGTIPDPPEPAVSIQPVKMPGDGIDAEGQPVAPSPVAASTPARHEEL